MPNWKKLIVSGSDAALNSLNIATSISGSTLQLTNPPSQASEATSLMIGASGNVGTRELGSNAFNSTSFTTCTGTVTGTGTTNYVSKWTGIGSQGNSQIFDDGTDVGIGTTSPGYKLNVTNDDNTQTTLDSLTFKAVSTAYAGTIGVFENTSGINTNIEIKDTVDSFYIVSRNGIGGFGSSGGWSSNNINISTAGNVGIGDRNPSTNHKLTVKRNGGYGIKVDGTQIGFYQGTTFRGSIGPEFDSSLFDINGQSNIRFKINNSLVGRWNSSGYFGIGTQDPDLPLDINMSGAKARIWNTSGSPSLELRGTNGQIKFTDQDPVNTEFLMINRGSNFAFKKNGIGQDYIFISTSGSSDGNIGIGSNFNQQNPPSAPLDVDGTARVTTLVETSARRYKGNIVSLQDQLDNLKKLEPVEFEWKETKKKDFGLIAEDVEKIYPHLVEHDDNGDLIGVKYSKLTTVLVKALQQQQEQIEELKKEIFIIKNNLNG